MKILFLSDLHLGARYIGDKRAHESKICKFLNECGKDADHIYLLGDVLDYWYEYRHVVPRGFVRFFGTLSLLTDSGVKITWITGNHDIWLFDYIRQEIGLEVIDMPYIIRRIAGKNFILSHGDRLCDSNLSFNLISRIFRNKICQKLYSSVHPRWTVPLAHRWSMNSRYSHSLTDSDESEHLNLILSDAERFVSSHPGNDFLVMGHHHLVVDKMIPGTECRLLVLGDWIDHFTYGIFDGNKFEIKRYYS